MKIYLEDDNGTKFEVKEIESLPEGANVLFFMMEIEEPYEIMKENQRFLEQQTGVKCIILPPRFNKILGLKK